MASAVLIWTSHLREQSLNIWPRLDLLVELLSQLFDDRLQRVVLAEHLQSVHRWRIWTFVVVYVIFVTKNMSLCFVTKCFNNYTLNSKSSTGIRSLYTWTSQLGWKARMKHGDNRRWVASIGVIDSDFSFLTRLIGVLWICFVFILIFFVAKWSDPPYKDAVLLMGCLPVKLLSNYW